MPARPTGPGPAVLGLAALALASCSTAPPRVGLAPPQVANPQQEKQYEEVYRRWTRTAEVYALFDSRMFVGATFQSPEFVRARVRRMGTFQQIPAAQVQARLSQQLAHARQGYDFFLGVHTGDPGLNDFDAVHSVWRVALRASAGEVTPVSVVRVGRLDPNLRGIYRFLGDFWRGYRVVFPLALPNGQPLVAPGERTVQLTLDSSMGHIHLRFPAVALALSAPMPDAGTP